MELCANYLGQISVGDGDELAAQNFCPMESHQFYYSALRSVPENQAHFPLRSTSRRHYHQRSHYVISQPITKIILVGNPGICQYHYVEATNIHRLGGPRDPGAPSIVYVEGPEG